MANVTVVFEYEEPEYCRLCLAEPTKHNELTTIRDAAASDIHKDILPIIRELLKIELDPEKDAGSFICSTCLESLVEFHHYRSRCQINNDTLQKKAIERKQNQIELAKSAIHNTNVLEHVKDGDPIKVIIRMNTEGKGSIRLQVQSKQPVLDASPPPEPPTKKPTAAPSATTVKPVKLQKQEFFFYKTQNSKRGLIYDGFRYCVSIPRLNGTHWVCEHRRSHKCMALLYVDKTYSAFYLHSNHTHSRSQQIGANLPNVYKSVDVLNEVMENEEQIRKTREIEKANAQQDNTRPNSATHILADSTPKNVQVKEESDSDSEKEDDEMNSNILSKDAHVQVKEESDSNSEEEDDEIISLYGLSTSGASKPVQLQLPFVKVKDVPPSTTVAVTPPPTKRIKINAGDNTYFIKELT
ncbi:uncharacterized protein LOC134226421 [Armigeres subalbatus]|uniref:uncharacterized protein LOC134226421 n=1 Tax=Armigeres subalbatus TaxID=124917 RepID=UPI002ED59E2B